MPSIITAEMSVRELLGVYVAVLDELLKRGITRTRNAPLGDLAEYIAWRAYGGEIETNSKKSYDILDSEGRKLQVKARLVAGAKNTDFSAIRSWDFDAAVFLVLDARTYEVTWARELSLAETEALGRHVALTNSHAISTRHVLPLGIDVTDRIRGAFAEMDLT
ncbi:DUF6998 domain-containing protein [Pseudolysinimonas yzui]|uniref:DUF6998 domain-containing protein n=1 Tax=Pseudolysinimonas yzui TaxID=2708254 RepID=A0A8J3GQG3_9MICO|nr:hypothetical protein [Pseudolysinimonas yzui]GHF14832.1 hypothetical protein GCM10011600_14740 [Pseudolysinimonas yzui]